MSYLMLFASELYVDKVEEDTFKQNFYFSNEYNSVHVSQDEKFAKVNFIDGISLEISIVTAETVDPKKGKQRLSWLFCNVYLMKTFKTYKNKIFGLMGNYNGDKNDDIFTRNLISITDINSERAIFPIASECKFFISKKFFNIIKKIINLRESK